MISSLFFIGLSRHLVVNWPAGWCVSAIYVIKVFSSIAFFSKLLKISLLSYRILWLFLPSLISLLNKKLNFLGSHLFFWIQQMHQPSARAKGRIKTIFWSLKSILFRLRLMLLENINFDFKQVSIFFLKTDVWVSERYLEKRIESTVKAKQIFISFMKASFAGIASYVWPTLPRWIVLLKHYKGICIFFLICSF